MQLNMGNKFWSQLITYEGLQHVAFKALHIRHAAIIQVEVFWRSLVVGYPNIVNVISYLYGFYPISLENWISFLVFQKLHTKITP